MKGAATEPSTARSAMKPIPGSTALETRRDSLTTAWRRGEITTKDFHSQWVAMAVRDAARKRQRSTRPQP